MSIVGVASRVVGFTAGAIEIGRIWMFLPERFALRSSPDVAAFRAGAIDPMPCVFGNFVKVG